MPIGSDKQQQASLCRFGSNAIKVSLVANSCSCVFQIVFGLLRQKMTIRFPLCADIQRDNSFFHELNTMYSFCQEVLCIVID